MALVADPIAQDNDKRNNVQKKKNIYIYTQRNCLFKYTEGADKTSQYSYPVVILSNWVPSLLVLRKS